VLADVNILPLKPATLNLITASNLLFLLPDPLAALKEMARLLAPNGEIALLNPSEEMSLSAATLLADERNLEGLARETLLNYAARAENHHRWNEDNLIELFASANLKLIDTTTKMGKGLVRLARGKKE
jgi:ubiquinone/menaquinone biosynthesis C-methylase UbiE